MIRQKRMPFKSAIFFGTCLFLLNMLFEIYNNTGNIKTSIITVLGLITACILMYYLYKMKQHNDIIKSNIATIDKMTGEEFEDYLLLQFKKKGYRGNTTSKTGDYGADLVLTKNNIKTVIQAKRWKWKVGIEAVQQITGALKYYNADKGIVITNSNFTPNAVNLARVNGIELWDRRKLIDFINTNE